MSLELCIHDMHLSFIWLFYAVFLWYVFATSCSFNCVSTAVNLRSFQWSHHCLVKWSVVSDSQQTVTAAATLRKSSCFMLWVVCIVCLMILSMYICCAIFQVLRSKLVTQPSQHLNHFHPPQWTRCQISSMLYLCGKCLSLGVELCTRLHPDLWTFVRWTLSTVQELIHTWLVAFHANRVKQDCDVAFLRNLQVVKLSC